MPFRQLKSFLKILIGVQYERLHPPLSPPRSQAAAGTSFGAQTVFHGFCLRIAKTELSVFIRVLLCKGVV